MEITLYRVVQEALTNIARHAQARHVYVRLERRESVVTALIEDDGQGFDLKAMTEEEDLTHTMGLLGMRERVASLKGRFDIRSRPGQGTRLEVEVPV